MAEQIGSYGRLDKDGVSGSRFNIRTPSEGLQIGPVNLSGQYARQERKSTPQALGMPEEFVQFMRERGSSLAEQEEKFSTWNVGISAQLPGGVLPPFMEKVLRPESFNAKYGRSQFEATNPFGQRFEGSDRERAIGGQGRVLEGLFGENAPSVGLQYEEPNRQESIISGNVTIPFQQGGIASLPKNPVLAGQEHMLAYITPEEASTLREQGGGVTPTGGQYRGPSGVPAFMTGMGQAAAAAAGVFGGGTAAFGGAGTGNGGATSDPGHPKSMAVQQAQQQAVAESAPPAPPTPANVDISSMMTPHKTPQLNMALSIAENNAQKSIAALDANNVPQLQAKLSKMDPRSMAYADLQGKLSQAMDAAVSDGYSSGAISKANQVANMNVPDAMGNVTLALTLGDQEFTAFDIANMSDAEFSALSANPATGVKGDPKSPLGMATLGLATPVLSMLAPPLAVPLTAMEFAYGLANPDEPSLGLMGLAEQALGTSLGDIANQVGGKLGLGETPVGDVMGHLGLDNLGQQIGDVFGEVTPSTATTPDVPGGPGLPVVSPTQTVSLENPFPQTTTETLLDATSSDYTAEQLANITGVSVEQAQEYLDSQYPKPVDVLPTTAETVQGTVSPDYTAEQLANITGVSIGQAQEYLDSRYSQLT